MTFSLATGMPNVRPGCSGGRSIGPRFMSIAPWRRSSPVDDLRRSPTAALFEGGDDVDVAIFVTRYERGQGPDLHVHPYAEVFVVRAGTAVFTPESACAADRSLADE